MHQLRLASFVVVVLIALASLVAVPTTAAAQPNDDFVPVTDAMLQDPAPEDWPMWRRTLDGWGYSPLDQIDRGNVGDLRMVWSRGLAPAAGGHAAGLRRRPLHAPRRATSSRPSTR